MLTDGWIECRLADACSSIDYGLTAPASATAVGPRFLRITDIVTGHINWDSVPYVDAEETTAAKYALRHGDIVLARTGASTGSSAYIKDPPNAVFASYLVRLVARPEFDSRFLAYYLKSELFWSFIRGVLGDKSAQPNASASTMTSAPLRAPFDKSEQHAIAEILGALDDKIEANGRMNATLDAMARALFRSWFVDFDPVRAKADGRTPSHMDAATAALFPDTLQGSSMGSIPAGWQASVFDDLIASALGGDWGQSVASGAAPTATKCLRGADIPALQAGGAVGMPVRYLAAPSVAKRSLAEGDLVIEISGGSPTQSTGRPVLVTDALLKRLEMPLVCSNFCRLIKLKSTDASAFAYLWLRHLYDQDELLQFENGTTGIKNLAFTAFRSSYPLCVPSGPVLARFGETVSNLFRLQQANGAESDLLAELRDTLLPKLISGELRVRDASRTVEAAV